MVTKPQTLPRKHVVDNYLLNPTNPITVNVIGAGGTGSQVLTALARMDASLFALGHPGLFVVVWDDDVVTQANIGRQLYAQSELHMSKAEAIISRINRFYGTYWKAQKIRVEESLLTTSHANQLQANITITCVDTVKARQQVAAILKRTPNNNHGPQRLYYWMDFGNSQQSGQVIISTVGRIPQPKGAKTIEAVEHLPFITEEYGESLTASETGDDTPSCSLAEALKKQDLYINSTLAQMGSALLWSMFRTGLIEHRGFFLNLRDFRSQPLKV